MSQVTLPDKSIRVQPLLLVITFFCLIAPKLAHAQNPSTYYVMGAVVNGIQLIAVQLQLLDSTRKEVTALTSDSMGSFKFTGLRSGKYYIANKAYKLDTSFAIQDKSIDGYIIELNACEVNAIQASKDLKSGKAKLLLIGSIAPVYYRGQESFEKKYHIQYYDYGCTPPPLRCVIDYNRTVFKYLDKEYGKPWRKEVRKDVIGYK